MYGSCSKGIDVEDSDIDLFILSSDKERARNEISKMRKRIQRKISPVVMDINEYSALKRQDRIFYDNINMGIVLFDDYEL